MTATTTKPIRYAANQKVIFTNPAGQDLPARVVRHNDDGTCHVRCNSRGYRYDVRTVPASRLRPA